VVVVSGTICKYSRGGGVVGILVESGVVGEKFLSIILNNSQI
jgi:hypothetical protein